MPTPNPDESQDDFMSRCILELIDNEERSQGQAIAMCASFWEESQTNSKQIEMVAAPANEQGMTAAETRQAVVDQGNKFPKEDAVYVQPSPSIEVACGWCTFWQGLDINSVGQCEVVNGGISWYGTSELYINGELQAAFEEANRESIDESGEVEELNMNKRRDEPQEHKTLPFIVTKIDEAQGLVEHTVAVMGNVDLGGDRIHPGAFTKTISERMHKIKALDSHNTDSVLRVVGKPIMMKEIGKLDLPVAIKQEFPNATGALMATTQFLIDTPEGNGVFERIKAGAVDQYSIGYDALDVDFTEEEIDGKRMTVRNLRTIKLFEYSPVIFGMNPATSTLSAKDDKGPSGKTDLPIASRERAWDASAATAGIRQLTDSEDEPSGQYRNGFFWFDGENADSFGGYKLPFSANIDGDLTAVPRGIFAVAGALSGARGGVDIPASDLPGVRSRVSRYYSRMREQFDDDSIVPPWEKSIDLVVSTKAENLTKLVQDVTMAFYATYPDSHREMWWIKQVWDDALIVEQQGIVGSKMWKVPYTIDDKGISFASQGEWAEVELVFQPKGFSIEIEAKVGRAISAANAQRIQRAIDSAQAALATLEDLLAGALPQIPDEEEDETGSRHRDDEHPKESPSETSIKAVEDDDDSQDQTEPVVDEAGPVKELPTSGDSEAILAEIEQALRQYDKELSEEGS